MVVDYSKLWSFDVLINAVKNFGYPASFQEVILPLTGLGVNFLVEAVEELVERHGA